MLPDLSLFNMYVFSMRRPGVVVEAGTVQVCAGDTVALVKGTSLFLHSLSSLSHMYASPPLWCTTSSASLLLLLSVHLPALLFSQHACRPRGEGRLLPFGQLREAVFAPGFCPAEQTALLLQRGQSLGPSL